LCHLAALAVMSNSSGCVDGGHQIQNYTSLRSPPHGTLPAFPEDFGDSDRAAARPCGRAPVHAPWP